jgi:spermidine/putrescine-binding protein
MRSKRWLAVAPALAMLLAACGGGEAGGDGDGGSGDVVCEAGVVDGDLRFYNWSEYIDPDLVTAFEEEYGVSVISDFYESNEAMLSQIQAGVVWDLIVPSDYMVGIMIAEGLLQPLQKDAIPNLVNLADDFTDPPYDPGLVYSAAYQYGTTGLAVNKALVGEDFPRSWAMIFDPALTANFPGGVSVLNDPRETMGAALKYLGYSLNETSDEALQAAAQTIADAKPGIATFDSDQYSTALVTGEVAVAHGYSGNMITAILDADDPEQFEYFLPEEGATLWIDNMAIPTNSSAPCTAHAFIDWLLDADNGAQLTNYNYYGSPNAAAQPMIDQEVIDFYAGTQAAEDLEVIRDTGADEIKFTDYLAQAKS